VSLSYDDVVAGLIARGTEPDRARVLALRVVDNEKAQPKLGQSVLGIPFQGQQADRAGDVLRLPEDTGAGLVALPFRLVVPWSELCSDNEHEVGAVRMVDGRPVPFKKMTARYKASRDAIHARAVAITMGATPRREPLALRAEVWVPSAQTGNDHLNFAKVVHDALQRVVYQNDRQLHDIHWKRMGIFVDRPRVEIEISLL
jgi:hypothetical protein